MLRLIVRGAVAGVIGLSLLAPPGALAAPNPYPWLSTHDPAASLERRFPVPRGYERIPLAEGSFGRWLRGLPLKEGNPLVHLYNGFWKPRLFTHAAVVDLDVGEKDLQQCADSVIRLRAEYLYSQERDAEIAFHFTSGDLLSWAAWLSGRRPRVKGNKVAWEEVKPVPRSRESFARYLEVIFSYAGTASLEKEMARLADPAKVLPGDALIQGGFPGHAVLVLDVAENPETRRRVYLLGQGFTPAQELEVLKNPRGGELSPWYEAGGGGAIETPQWDFQQADWRRFPKL